MIPKVIHYCWFGGKEMPTDVQKCIESWRKYCPDYEIKRWDESNYDVLSHPYTKEAYKEKKWAFVSDFARLRIIYENGGIYLDTDVELIKPLDNTLESDFFFAIQKHRDLISNETDYYVATGLGFGAEKNNEVVLSMIDEYNGAHFVIDDKMDLTPCTKRNTNALKKLGYAVKDKTMSFNGGIIFASDYFCPIDYNGKDECFTDNTISIHHYSASWISFKDRIIIKIKEKVIKVLKFIDLK